MRSSKSLTGVVGLTTGVLALAGAVPLAGAWSAAAAAVVKPCAPTQIKVSHGGSQGAAGTTYIPIIFTDTAGACAIWGVPGIQPVVGAMHRPVGPAARNISMGQMPVRHVLTKGRSVSAGIGVVDAGNFSPGSCGARAADGVMVSLGTFVHSKYVHLAITVCTKRSSVTTRLVVAGVSGS